MKKYFIYQSSTECSVGMNGNTITKFTAEIRPTLTDPCFEMTETMWEAEFGELLTKHYKLNNGAYPKITEVNCEYISSEHRTKYTVFGTLTDSKKELHSKFEAAKRNVIETHTETLTSLLKKKKEKLPKLSRKNAPWRF